MKKTVAIVFILTLALLLIGCASNAQIQNYNKGVEAYNLKDFEAAKAYFEAAEDYLNSKSYLSAIQEYERIYTDALNLFNAHKYPEAKTGFEAISEFGNSAEYVAFIDKLEQRYNEGVEAFEKQDYSLAYERFTQAMGYNDADEFVSRISKLESNYNNALEFMKQGSYLRALELFEMTDGKYRDSAERIERLYELIAKQGIIPRMYAEFFNRSFALANEDVTITPSGDTSGSFAWKASNGLIVMGSTDTEGYITSISFWMDRELLKTLDEEGSTRLFAHCIQALNINSDSLDSIMENMDYYFEGSRTYCGFSFLLDEDASGAEVLTAEK